MSNFKWKLTGGVSQVVELMYKQREISSLYFDVAQIMDMDFEYAGRAICLTYRKLYILDDTQILGICRLQTAH